MEDDFKQRALQAEALLERQAKIAAIRAAAMQNFGCNGEQADAAAALVADRCVFEQGVLIGASAELSALRATHGVLFSKPKSGGTNNSGATGDSEDIAKCKRLFTGGRDGFHPDANRLAMSDPQEYRRLHTLAQREFIIK